MMNEFGVPMNDAEMNMLPPGYNKPHDRLLAESGLEMNWWQVALAAVGMGLGYLNGKRQDQRMSDMAEAQFEQDKLNWEFNWQEAQDAYTYQVEDIDIAKFNLAQQKKYRDQSAINEWIDKDKARMFDYNNQVDAYNAGVEDYKTQLDVNQIGADLAENAARRVYNEKLITMGYQLESSDINTARALKKTGLSRKELKAQLKEGKRTSKTQREILKENLNARKKDLASKIEQQDIAGIEALGQIRSLGQTGRSGRKNRLRAIQSTNRLVDALEYASDHSERKAALDLKAIDIKLEALGDRLDITDEGLVDDLYNTRRDQDFTERQLSDQLKSTNLEFEHEVQQRKLEKYSIDLQASAKLNPKPQLAPQLSKPLEMPEPVLQKPRAPRKGPKPIRYAASTGHGLAALASGMASLGTAAAAYSAKP